MKLPTWGVYECLDKSTGCDDDADFSISYRDISLAFTLDDTPLELSRTCPSPLPFQIVEWYSRTWLSVPLPDTWVIGESVKTGAADLTKFVWSNLFGPAASSTIQPVDVSDGHGHHFWAFRWETVSYVPQNAGCTQYDINACSPLAVTVLHDPRREHGVADFVDIWLVKADGGSCHHYWSGGIQPQYSPCRRTVVDDYCLTPLNLVPR